MKKTSSVNSLRKAAVPAKEKCWHCHGSHTCDCIFCGHDAYFEERVQWLAGDCVACKGAKESAELRKLLEREKIDPRERQHWKRVGNPRDQAPPHPVFVPRDKFKKGET